MFSKILKRSSWTDIIISMIFILFGILIVAKPEETVNAISIILGMLFVAVGVLKLIEYFTSEEKNDYLLTTALLMVIIGAVILFASGAILSVFKFILGIWIIAVGIMDLQTIFAWKETKSPYWTVSLLITLLMILSGIIIVVVPNIIETAIGVIIIIYGISLKTAMNNIYSK